jgi:hypothetical protein
MTYHKVLQVGVNEGSSRAIESKSSQPLSEMARSGEVEGPKSADDKLSRSEVLEPGNMVKSK